MVRADSNPSNGDSEATLGTYHSHLRVDVLGVVPSDARYILSVGCAAGATEEQLVRRGCTVAGIEIHPEAAALARTRGITVIEADASTADVSQLGVMLDFIVYADVLEHLPDPEGVLRRHVQLLRPGGGVYISVPNFRHYSVLWQLAIGGEVRYSDAGILDRTHVRITTRKMLLRWLQSAGLKPVDVRCHIYARRFRFISALSCGLVREFLASQVTALAFRPV